jgi:hypothetical protein
VSAPAALEDYLITLSTEFAKLRVTSEPHEAFDDEIVESIEQELPYRNEYVEVITLAARYWNADYVQKLHKFFETVAAYLSRPANMTSYNNWSFDNFYFIIDELFLYTISILLRAGRLRDASELLTQQYYVPDPNNRAGPMWNFTLFNHHASSLDHRNKRLKLNRLSLHADLLEKRSHNSSIPFADPMQADFVLYLRDVFSHGLEQSWRGWWPFTLLYAGRFYNRPFELFARAQSANYFNSVMLLLGAQSKAVFDAVMTEFSDGRRQPPRWQFDSFDPVELANWSKISSKP